VIELERFIAAQTNKTISVALYDLAGGQEILIHPDQVYHPASTFKVHVMMEVFHQAQEGVHSLSDAIAIRNSFTSIADGSSFSLDQADDAEKTLYACLGETESIAELTRLMIVRSSNLATNILLERLGAKNVNNFIRTLGIGGVTVMRGVEDNAAYARGMNNRATAPGLTHTMRLLAEGAVVSPDACQQMIDILLAQEFNESIPALLPDTVRVAHKTGWTGDVHHDTGIVYPEQGEPYALTIMTRGWSEAQDHEAHACMAQISRMIYERLL
jgi:beta-lactamase class A